MNLTDGRVGGRIELFQLFSVRDEQIDRAISIDFFSVLDGRTDRAI